MIKIQEAKQVGILYHYTSIESALRILDEDTLQGHIDTKTWKGSISFTRDKNFEKAPGRQIASMEVRMAFNGDRLSDFYKIWPYNYFNDYPDTSKTGVPHKDLEAEECISTEKLHDVSRFLIGVDILVGHYSTPFDYHWRFHRVKKAIEYLMDKLSKEEQLRIKEGIDLDFKIDTRYIAKYIEEKYNIPCRVLSKR